MRVSLYEGRDRWNERLVGTVDGEVVELGGVWSRSYPGRLVDGRRVVTGRYSSEQEIGGVSDDRRTIVQGPPFRSRTPVAEVDSDGQVYLGTGRQRERAGRVDPPSAGAAACLVLLVLLDTPSGSSSGSALSSPPPQRARSVRQGPTNADVARGAVTGAAAVAGAAIGAGVGAGIKRAFARKPKPSPEPAIDRVNAAETCERGSAIASRPTVDLSAGDRAIVRQQLVELGADAAWLREKVRLGDDDLLLRLLWFYFWGRIASLGGVTLTEENVMSESEPPFGWYSGGWRAILPQRSVTGGQGPSDREGAAKPSVPPPTTPPNVPRDQDEVVATGETLVVPEVFEAKLFGAHLPFGIGGEAPEGIEPEGAVIVLSVRVLNLAKEPEHVAVWHFSLVGSDGCVYRSDTGAAARQRWWLTPRLDGEDLQPKAVRNGGLAFDVPLEAVATLTHVRVLRSWSVFETERAGYAYIRLDPVDQWPPMPYSHD